MTETKAFWKSRGFWGPVFAIVAMALQSAGLGEIDQGQLVDFAMTTTEVFGLALGIIGRARATKRLGLRDQSAPPPTSTPTQTGRVAGAGLQAAWPAVLAALVLALSA